MGIHTACKCDRTVRLAASRPSGYLVKSFSTKDQARVWIRGTIETLSESEKQSQTEQILQELENTIMEKSAHRKVGVFAFAALPYEPNILALMDRLGEHRFYLPRVVSSQEMVFCNVTPTSVLVRGRFNIQEPSQHATIAVPIDGDVVIVPSLGLAHPGHRLGHGKGYYDRYLASFKSVRPHTIGVCWRQAFFQDLLWPAAPSDIMLAECVWPL